MKRKEEKENIDTNEKELASKASVHQLIILLVILVLFSVVIVCVSFRIRSNREQLKEYLDFSLTLSTVAIPILLSQIKPFKQIENKEEKSRITNIVNVFALFSLFFFITQLFLEFCVDLSTIPDITILPLLVYIDMIIFLEMMAFVYPFLVFLLDLGESSEALEKFDKKIVSTSKSLGVCISKILKYSAFFVLIVLFVYLSNFLQKSI